MSLVVATEPSSLEAVDAQCATVEAWAAECGSVPELRDALNKMAAIDEYLSRTARDGRARSAATMRYLEARIGTLLGAPQPGTRTDLSVATDGLDGLSRHQRNEFRQMASNPDVVNEVIAASTDNDPPSRRKVIAAIKEKNDMERSALIAKLGAWPFDAPTTASIPHLANPERCLLIAKAYEAGFSHREIADAVGIEASAVGGDVRLAARIAAGEITEAEVAATTRSLSSTRVAVDARVEKAKTLAASGHTSRQISAAIGIVAESFTSFKARHGINVPADNGIARSRRIDPNRVVNEIALSLEAAVMTLDLIDIADLDPTQIDHWATSISNSLKPLNRLCKQLKEMTQ